MLEVKPPPVSKSTARIVEFVPGWTPPWCTVPPSGGDESARADRLAVI